MPYLQIEHKQGVAVVWLDQPGEKVNKLALEMVDEFRATLDALEKDDRVRAVVLISKKEDTFIAGADLEALMSLTRPGEVAALARKGHEIFNRLADFPKPVVAAIHGAALGGGMEVALACHYRIATDSPKTILGQPEVKLGLLPAGGGTQRLPRLVGLQRALDIMLTGKNIYPYPAKKMGLVDDVIHPYGLLDAAQKVALRLAKGSPKRKRKDSLLNKALEGTSFTRGIIYKKARQMVERQTRGNYPAPLRIIDCVEAGLEKGFEAGLEAEADGFEALARTPQAEELINLFFGITAQKKHPAKDKVRPVEQIAVLGAGLMGAGIANVSAVQGYRVLLKDINYENVAAGEKSIWEDLNRKVRKKALSAFDRDQIFNRVGSVVDYSAFRKVDMVIEAVFEDLELKRRVIAETEAATGERCIFASNTSSLPISEMAATAKRPELIIGMHYFSPVPKMPLLEVIITPKTADWVTASAVEVGIRQGKTVIVVKDGPGFYTTRILAPMFNEALLLLEEKGEIRHIDQVMRDFGFPVGPFTLIDEVGIDVGAHVSGILAKLFAARGVKPSDAMPRMFADGYKGRKNQKGFYHYHADAKSLTGIAKKKKEVNQNAYKFFGGPRRAKQDPEAIQQRLLLVMVNEAAHCLQEGIISTPRDGDLGAVMGLGFPPFLGGPFRYLDRRGAQAVLDEMLALEQVHGPRFTPAEVVREYARGGRRFYA